MLYIARCPSPFSIPNESSLIFTYLTTEENTKISFGWTRKMIQKRSIFSISSNCVGNGLLISVSTTAFY